jgi:hypothetical protein
VKERRMLGCLPRSSKHAPLSTIDRARIVGCTCGGGTPPGTTDSDDALVTHVALAKAEEQL